MPERIISDNAKNFKDCSKRITSLSSQILEAEKTQRYLASHGIRWQFIVERAPWWGGFYERLVGSVKRCLKKSLGKTLLSFPDIVTMVTEVEAVLNSRPLTFLYLDIGDNPQDKKFTCILSDTFDLNQLLNLNMDLLLSLWGGRML